MSFNDKNIYLNFVPITIAITIPAGCSICRHC